MRKTRHGRARGENTEARKIATASIQRKKTANAKHHLKLAPKPGWGPKKAPKRKTWKSEGRPKKCPFGPACQGDSRKNVTDARTRRCEAKTGTCQNGLHDDLTRPEGLLSRASRGSRPETRIPLARTDSESPRPTRRLRERTPKTAPPTPENLRKPIFRNFWGRRVRAKRGPKSKRATEERVQKVVILETCLVHDRDGPNTISDDFGHPP